MEQAAQQQEHEEAAQKPHQVWREDSCQRSEDKKRKLRIIEKIGKQFPKSSMIAKMNMLNDLRNTFKQSKSDHHGDCCEGRIKDRLHFVKKVPKPKTRKLFINKSDVNDLISQMNSPSFGIQQDPKEFDINRGMLKFTFFDKTPSRKPLPQVNVSEENSQESRPEVTRKFENCSIDSDSHISTVMDIQQQ